MVDEVIWRGRFERYSPLELVRFAQGSVGSGAAKVALEVLDEKLVRMGFKPR